MPVNNKAEQYLLNYLNLAILKFYISEFAMSIFSNYFWQKIIMLVKEKSKTWTLLFTDSQQKYFYLTPKVSLGTQNYCKKFLVLLQSSWVYQK